MKTTLLACLATLALALSAAAEWRTDFEAAKTEAKKDGKIIVMNFTGSDWCGFCIKMKKDALDMKAFTDYAAKNAVLVEVDFPSRKKLPAAQQKANEALRKKYEVEGYPTFVFADATGKEVGRHVGYLQGGPLAFIDRMEKAKAKARTP